MMTQFTAYENGRVLDFIVIPGVWTYPTWSEYVKKFIQSQPRHPDTSRLAMFLGYKDIETIIVTGRIGHESIPNS